MLKDDLDENDLQGSLKLLSQEAKEGEKRVGNVRKFCRKSDQASKVATYYKVGVILGKKQHGQWEFGIGYKECTRKWRPSQKVLEGRSKGLLKKLLDVTQLKGYF